MKEPTTPEAFAELTNGTNQQNNNNVANNRDGGKLGPTTSNEKLERRYNEILKENDGKLFEVH